MSKIGIGANFPPENPSLWDKTTSYSLVASVICPSVLFMMHVLNRTEIVGRQHIRNLNPPWMLMSNHVTLLDDVFLDPLILFPHMYKGYRYIPFHAPEERNFYKNSLSAWFMKKVKAIPLMRGRGPLQEGMDRLISAVKSGGLLHIYPEGTRTRSGKIERGKSGVGRLIHESGAPVVPMYHHGLHRVLPIGSGFPRFGNRIRVMIGAPITFEEELKMPNDVHTWKIITARVMEAIKHEQEKAEQHWGADVLNNIVNLDA